MGSDGASQFIVQDATKRRPWGGPSAAVAVAAAPWAACSALPAHQEVSLSVPIALAHRHHHPLRLGCCHCLGRHAGPSSPSSCLPESDRGAMGGSRVGPCWPPSRLGFMPRPGGSVRISVLPHCLWQCSCNSHDTPDAGTTRLTRVTPSMTLHAALGAVTGDALLSAAAVASASTLVAHVGGVLLCQGGGGTPTARRPLLHGPSVELHFLLSGGARHLVLQAFSFVSGSGLGQQAAGYGPTRPAKAAAAASGWSACATPTRFDCLPCSAPPPLRARRYGWAPSWWRPRCCWHAGARHRRRTWTCSARRARWQHVSGHGGWWCNMQCRRAAPLEDLLPCLAHLSGPPCPWHCLHTPAADCALLFQVKALLVFEPGEPLQLLARAFASGSSSLCWDVSRLPSRTARAYIVTGGQRGDGAASAALAGCCAAGCTVPCRCSHAAQLKTG